MITAVCPNCFEEFERRGSNRGGKPYCPPCKEESKVKKRELDRRRREEQVPENEVLRAFSSIANRVGEGFSQDMHPACQNYITPDIWYSDEPSTSKEENALKTMEARVAMRLCNECPMQMQCLDYAMTDGDAIKYGIWGGTFAYERLGKSEPTRKSTAHTFQRKLRKKFEQEGLVCPPIPSELIPSTARNATSKRRAKVRHLLELGYSHIEIADRLNMSIPTAWSDVSYLQRESGAQS